MWYYWLIPVVIVLVVVLIIISKNFKDDKTTVEKNNDDDDVIKKNANEIGMLIALAEESDEAIKEKLKQLKHTADFVSVSPKSGVLKVDQKIAGAIAELKMLLSKQEKTTVEIILGKIKDIEVLYAHRKTEYEA